MIYIQALTLETTLRQGSDFPLENLPYGIFSTAESPLPRIGVAIGDQILDVSQVCQFFVGPELSRLRGALTKSALNEFLALGPAAWKEARTTLQRLLSKDESAIRDNDALRSSALVPQQKAHMHLPAVIGDYTDFFSSKYHAANCGRMFFGEGRSLTPNWEWAPLAYHGRSSSIVPSGTCIRRPWGQQKPPNVEAPIFEPSKMVDFELETAFLVGPGNELGTPIPADRASEHIFGMVLLNDWSARDIQMWESSPLGPFLGKSFATTISPWVVTMDALEPFRAESVDQSTSVLSYLRCEGPNSYDINLEVTIKCSSFPFADSSDEAHTICRSNFRYLYWSMNQQLAHHTSNGCNVRPGDLIASGTISGPNEDSLGCMLELSWRGTKSIPLGNGASRKFLEDGDEAGVRIRTCALVSVIAPLRNDRRHRMALLRVVNNSSRIGPVVLRSLCSTVSVDSKVSSADVFGTLSSLPSTEDDDEEENVEFKPLVVMERSHLWFGRRCNKLARQGKIAECVAMLQKRMPEDGVKPKRYNYVMVLGWLGRYGLAKKAFEVHEQMEQMKIRPSRHTYTSLLNACANSVPSEASWALARVDEVLKRARALGNVSLDRGLYHAAIKAYRRSGDIQSALLVADLMITDGLSPDVITFTHVLQACMNDKQSGFVLALRVWQYMLKSGIAPNAEAMNNFIRICRDCGLGPQGDALLERWSANEHSEIFLSEGNNNPNCPNIHLISSAADHSDAIALSNGQHVNAEGSNSFGFSDSGAPSVRSLKLSLIGGAQSLFDHLKRANVRPNKKTFTLMLDLLPNDSSSEEWLLKVMRESRVPADLTFHNALIRRRAQRGNMEEALALLHSLQKRNVTINENTLHCLAHGCWHQDDGLALCQKAKDLGLSLSLATCHVLMRKALTHFDFVYARHLLDYMQRASIPCNKRFLRLIEEELAKAGKLPSRQDDQSSSAVKAIGISQFKRFYEKWLHSTRLAKQTDPRERLLDKQVSADDLRESWEKPWAKQQRTLNPSNGCRSAVAVYFRTAVMQQLLVLLLCLIFLPAEVYSVSCPNGAAVDQLNACLEPVQDVISRIHYRKETIKRAILPLYFLTYGELSQLCDAYRRSRSGCPFDYVLCSSSNDTLHLVQTNLQHGCAHVSQKKQSCIQHSLKENKRCLGSLLRKSDDPFASREHDCQSLYDFFSCIHEPLQTRCGTSVVAELIKVIISYGCSLEKLGDSTNRAEANCFQEDKEAVTECFAPLQSFWHLVRVKNPEFNQIGFPLYHFNGYDLERMCEMVNHVKKSCSAVQRCPSLPVVQFTNALLGYACGHEQQTFLKHYQCIRECVHDQPVCSEHIHGAWEPGYHREVCRRMPAFFRCLLPYLLRRCSSNAVATFAQSIRQYWCDIGSILDLATLMKSIDMSFNDKTTILALGTVHMNNVEPNPPTSGPPLFPSPLTTITTTTTTMPMTIRQQSTTLSPSKFPITIRVTAASSPPPPVTTTVSSPSMEIDADSGCSNSKRILVRQCLEPLFERLIELHHLRRLENFSFPLYHYGKKEIMDLCDLYATSFLQCPFTMFQECAEDHVVYVANALLGYFCSPQHISSFHDHYDCISLVVRNRRSCDRYILGAPLIEGLIEGEDGQRISCDRLQKFYSCSQLAVDRSCPQTARIIFKQSLQQFGCDLQ
ncbi:hypothetical protein M514_03229 [Trichuris suis]|uniref:Fumarylacetoacetase n=1 Tax=Trichuris suis TaxID=68888 RepID=A0A085MX17_9BILA|nr:hypothetical protein M514_03229 [Trichuris suis]